LTSAQAEDVTGDRDTPLLARGAVAEGRPPPGVLTPAGSGASRACSTISS
jgi:hypothetical protein